MHRPFTAQETADIVKFFGGSERQREELTQFRRNIEWMEGHYEEFLREHPNSWLVVLTSEDGSPYASIAEDFSGVRGVLDAVGIRRRTSVVQYLDPNPKPLILQALLQ